MKRPLSLEELTNSLDVLYRPSPRGHWQRRVNTLVCEWLARPDARVHWSQQEEADNPAAYRIAIPNRAHAPRWIGLDAPLCPEAATCAEQLVVHLGLVAELMSRHASPGDRGAPLRWVQVLTARQVDVALLAAAGRTNKEIAEELGIAPRTVARTLQEVYHRLNLNSRAELHVEVAVGRPPTPVELRTPTPPPERKAPVSTPPDEEDP